MKLATLRNGRPDGHLVIVSRDLSRFVSAGRIASTMQAALDEWQRCAPILKTVYEQLNRGEIAGMDFDPADCLAPLPRAYQWIDASSYHTHMDRIRALKGAQEAEPASQERVLLYQGASDSLIGPCHPIVVPADDLALDYEAEVAVILGDVPMGATREQAHTAIRLVTICNDVSLRQLAADDLENGFGFFHAKPATSFAPVVATPDELGPLWYDDKLHLKVRIHVNESLYGQPDAGVGTRYDFADLVAAAARTRRLGCGTILASGTISNAHDDLLPIKRNTIGFGCIVEARTAEKLQLGKAHTPFLKSGDRVRIEAVQHSGKPLFGRIDQRVSLLRAASE